MSGMSGMKSLYAYTVAVDGSGGHLTASVLDMAAGGSTNAKVERPTPTTLSVTLPRTAVRSAGSEFSFTVQSLSSTSTAHASSHGRDLQDANHDGVLDSEQTDQAGPFRVTAA
jgi:hypothetical protein